MTTSCWTERSSRWTTADGPCSGLPSSIRAYFVYHGPILLHLNGRDYLKVLLEERRARLAPIVVADTFDIERSIRCQGLPKEIEQVVRLHWGRSCTVVAAAIDLRTAVGVAALLRDQPGVQSAAGRIGGQQPERDDFELSPQVLRTRTTAFAGRVRAGLTPPVRAEIFRRIAPVRPSAARSSISPDGGKAIESEGVTLEDMANPAGSNSASSSSCLSSNGRGYYAPRHRVRRVARR